MARLPPINSQVRLSEVYLQRAGAKFRTACWKGRPLRTAPSKLLWRAICCETKEEWLDMFRFICDMLTVPHGVYGAWSSPLTFRDRGLVLDLYAVLGSPSEG